MPLIADKWSATYHNEFNSSHRCRINFKALSNGVLTAIFLGALSNANAAVWRLPPSVKIQQAREVVIEVDPSVVVRNDVPPALFGFNIPWMNFQRGYWRNGQVRPEVIAWLKPFKGAVYRYPGGEVSNWFEWQKAVGPSASRKEQPTTFGKFSKADFGLDEYLDFVKAVNGLPLLTVNLKGTKQRAWNDRSALKNNLEWLQYVINREGTASTVRLAYCQTGKKCPVQWWELGNELDWGEDVWTPEHYIARAKIVGTRMLSLDPRLQLIAQTTTAPWGKQKFVAEKFDKTIGLGLSQIAKGYAYHPYYDGISIPKINRSLEDVVNSLISGATASPPTIFVTEHARWPEKPLFGDWQVNWGQTGDLGGAISTADFLLAQMTLPNVGAAMWHALGAWGPWQLFYVNATTDKAYPNVVYWGMRVLREGLLDDSLKIHTASSNISGYRGGYDVRAVFMREKTGPRYSLMTVNRASVPVKARITVKGFKRKNFAISHSYITGKSSQVSNTSAAPNTTVIQTDASTLNFDANETASITLPPNSVSTFILQSVR